MIAGPDGLPCGFGYGTVCGVAEVYAEACADSVDGWGFMPMPGGGGGPVPCPPSPSSPDVPPQIWLNEIDDCIYPNGTSISGGKWTLEVEYQVVVNGHKVFGNIALANFGVSTISESVITTSGGPISGGGVWCLATVPCDAPGSLTANGTFWDVLAGNGEANQTFLLSGQSLGVTFPGTVGSSTVLKNVYNSKQQTISVNGALTANSATRECGSKHRDPPWH